MLAFPSEAFPISEIDFSAAPNPVNSEIEPSPVASRQKLILDLLPYSRKITRGTIFYFVSELEREIQKIQYQDYLTHHCKIIKLDSSPDVIFNTLLETHQHDSKYSKFNKLIIWECVHNYITKFRAMYKEQRLHDYRNLLRSLDIMWDTSPSHDQQEVLRLTHFSGLNIPDMSAELKAYKHSLYHGHILGGSEDPKAEMFPRRPPSQVQNRDTPANPVAELVSRLLGKTYVMDPNPVRELEKLKAHDPISYGGYFTGWKSERGYMRDESETVRVDNIPLDVTEDTMWTAFMSIGLTVHLEMTSGENSQTAFVTFSYPGTAKKALLLKDNIISNRSVKITQLSSYTPDNLYDDDYYDDIDNDEPDELYDDDYYDDSDSDEVEDVKISPSSSYEFQPDEESCRMLDVLQKYWNLCTVAVGPDFGV